MNASFLSLALLGTWVFPPADTIVWHVRGPEAPRFAVVEETLSIGGADDENPDYNFYGLTGMAIGRNGSMVVLQASLNAPQVLLRMYDREGRLVRSIGGMGQGPGEYSRPVSVATLSDGRILLTDPQVGRMTVYSADGEFEETWSVPNPFGIATRTHVAPDGVVAVEARMGPDRRRGVVRIGPGGTVLDTVFAPDLPELGPPTLEFRDPPRTITIAPPYYPGSTWAWHPHGYFVTARTDRYAIDLLLPRGRVEDAGRPARWRPGDPVVSIRAEVDPVPVHPQERRDHERALQGRVRRAQGQRSGSLGPVPAVKPIVSVIRAADDGRIWVSLHAESERFEPTPTTLSSGEVVEGIPWRQTFVFDVFQPNGVYLGRVRFPSGLANARFRGDEAWGFVYDDLGVPTLKRYRIHWPDPT
jgi:hypothetical protein